MLRLCLALLLCLSLLAGAAWRPALADAKAGDTVRITPLQADLRGGPGTKYPSVTTVYQDDQVPVLETRGNWLLVAIPRDGALVQGWISRDYTEESPDRRNRGGDRYGGADKGYYGQGNLGQGNLGQGNLGQGNLGHGGWTQGGRDQGYGNQGYGNQGYGSQGWPRSGSPSQGGADPSHGPPIQAQPGRLACGIDGSGAPVCQSEVDVRLDLSGQQMPRSDRIGTVTCRAILAYRGNGGGAGTVQSDFTLDLPLTNGRGGDRAIVTFDLPLPGDAPSDAVVRGVDCRLR